VEVDGESTSHDRGRAKRLQRSGERRGPRLRVGAASCPARSARPTGPVHLHRPDRGDQGPLPGHPARGRPGQGQRPRL